jgi:nucleotide-binding universal stress UspA family protein
MTIIAAVDLTPISVHAARTAARLARKLGDKLLLVRVLEPVSGLYPELSAAAGFSFPDIEGPLRKVNVETLENLRLSLLDEGVEIEARVLLGKPGKVLASCAHDEGARLIVVGSQGHGVMATTLMGSVAQRTVLESTCPVLTVRETAAPFDEWMGGKRPLRILVGVDRTPATAAALAWIGELRQAGPCDVVMVHEYWPPAEYVRLGLRGPREMGGTDPEVAAVLQRDLEAQLPALPGPGRVSLRIVGSWSRIGDGLAKEAAADRADLVVVGTHQPHGWDRIKMGSSALSALQWSATSVLCVPLRARAAEADPAHTEVPVIRSVLVATDFSDLGNSAIPQAYALLRGTGGTVELCHVHEHGLPHPVYVFDAKEQAMPAQLRRELEAKLEALVPAQAASLGITSRATVVDGGSAGTEIIQAARRSGADVIVVATHGRGGVGRALLGSVAESVVRQSDRPVHVVRG